MRATSHIEFPCAEQSVTKVALNVMVRAGFWVEETNDWLSRGRGQHCGSGTDRHESIACGCRNRELMNGGSVFKQTSTATVAVEPGAH